MTLSVPLKLQQAPMRPVLVLLMFALVACDRPTATAPRDVIAPAATTVAPSFVYLVSAPDTRTIHFRLTAPKTRALYLENCNGAISWGLEHPQSGEWLPAWSAEINGCHSQPIEIAAGTRRDFHETLAPRPGVRLVRGTYRLAVYGLYFTHANDHPAHSEVPHALRQSQSFELSDATAP